MEYIIKPRAARKIYAFYGKEAKKYRHTYDKEDYKRNVHDALTSIYDIERKLLRRPPALRRWAKFYMTNTDKWVMQDRGIIWQMRKILRMHRSKEWKKERIYQMLTDFAASDFRK